MRSTEPRSRTTRPRGTAATLNFQLVPTAMAPGNSTYALFSVKTANPSVAGTVQLIAGTPTGTGLAAHLTYGVRHDRRKPPATRPRMRPGTAVVADGSGLTAGRRDDPGRDGERGHPGQLLLRGDASARRSERGTGADDDADLAVPRDVVVVAAAAREGARRGGRDDDPDDTAEPAGGGPVPRPGGSAPDRRTRAHPAPPRAADRRRAALDRRGGRYGVHPARRARIPPHRSRSSCSAPVRCRRPSRQDPWPWCSASPRGRDRGRGRGDGRSSWRAAGDASHHHDHAGTERSGAGDHDAGRRECRR